MKLSARKKKEAEKVSDMRRGTASVDLTGLANLVEKAERDPELANKLRLQLFKRGVVVRIDPKVNTTKFTRLFSSIAKREEQSPYAAYLTAVKNLYLADNFDTEQAVSTAGRPPSAAEQEFYSQISSKKR